MNNNVSVYLSLTLINSSAFLNILSISFPFEWNCFALQLHSKKKGTFSSNAQKTCRWKPSSSIWFLFHEHFFILLEIFLSRIFFLLPNLILNSSIASSKLLYFQLKEEKTLLKRKSKCNLNYLLMSSSY